MCLRSRTCSVGRARAVRSAVVMMRGQTLQRLSQRQKEAGQSLHLRLVKLVRQRPRNDDPIFDRVAVRRWELESDRPAPSNGHPVAARGGRRTNASTCLAALGCRGRTARNPGARRPTPAAAILRAGRFARRRCRPATRSVASPVATATTADSTRPRKDQRERVNFPWSVGPPRIAVDVVRDAVLVDQIVWPCPSGGPGPAAPSRQAR